MTFSEMPMQLLFMLVFLCSGGAGDAEGAKILSIPAPSPSHVWYFNILSEHLTSRGHEVHMLMPEGTPPQVREEELRSEHLLVHEKTRGYTHSDLQNKIAKKAMHPPSNVYSHLPTRAPIYNPYSHFLTLAPIFSPFFYLSWVRPIFASTHVPTF